MATSEDILVDAKFLEFRETGLAMLDKLAAIRATGDDAESFLQGQLSNDVAALGIGDAQLSSLNSPQGRVVSILRIVRDSSGFLLIVPAWQREDIEQRLSRYILRAQVSLASEPDFQAIGHGTGNAGISKCEIMARLSYPGGLSESYGSKTSFASLEPTSPGWQAARIRAGIPELDPQTSEKYVAQMLNLDALDGISFTKGCYTGQEIIARAQHRGRVKRRTMVGRCEGNIAATDILVGNGGNKCGDVLESVAEQDHSIFLAVTSMASAQGDIRINDGNGAVVDLQFPAYLDGLETDS